MSDPVRTGALLVLRVRLDALAHAIRERAPWEDVEFAYDRVLRAYTKLAESGR